MASQAVLDLIATLHDNASAGMASIGDAAGKLGLVAGGVALAGVAALGAAVVAGVGDAREAAGLYAATEAVIKSTGGAAGVTATQVTDLATAMSAASGKSLFGDAAIQDAENMLLTFTNIGSDVFPRATQATVDMAQAFHSTPAAFDQMIGKALNSEAGFTSLKRAGVAFTDSQEEQIRTLFKAGDAAGAQTIILDELAKEFGGAAQAAADADGGWAQFTDRMGEAGEKVGAALLPLLAELAGFLLDDIVPAVETAAQAVSDWLQDPDVQSAIEALSDAVQNTLGQAFAFMTDTAIPALMDAWDLIQPAIDLVLPLFASDLPSGLQAAGQNFTLLQEVIDGVMAGILAIVAAVLPVILRFWEDNGAEIMAFVSATWDRIQQIIQLALELIQATVIPALQYVAQFISDHGDAIQTILRGAWDVIAGVISAALDLISGVVSIALDLWRGDWSQAWEDLKTMSATFVSDIAGAIEGFLNIIAGFFDTSLAEIAQLWTNNWNTLLQIVGDINWVAAGESVVEGIIEGVKNMAGSLFSGLKQMAQDAYDTFMDAIRGGSPAEAFMPAGESIVMGILQGMIDAMPAIEAGLAELGDRMIQQATRLADAARSALGAAYGSVASLDRQQAANMDAVAKLNAARQAGVEQVLASELQVAQKMTDPKAAADWYALRSKQLLELAKLQDTIDAAKTIDERVQLVEKYQLINAAGQAEMARFAVMHAAADSASQQLADQIQALLNATKEGILNNSALAQLAFLMDQLRAIQPKASGGPVESGMPYWVGEQGRELFIPRVAGTIVPSGQAGVVNNYYLTYETRQSSGSAAQDIQLLSLLYA